MRLNIEPRFETIPDCATVMVTRISFTEDCSELLSKYGLSRDAPKSQFIHGKVVGGASCSIFFTNLEERIDDQIGQNWLIVCYKGRYMATFTRWLR